MTGQRDVEERGDGSAGHHTRERMLAELPVTGRRLQLAGISSAVLEDGDGPPVILLQGPGEFAALWARVIPDLTTHRVVAPDPAGIDVPTIPIWGRHDLQTPAHRGPDCDPFFAQPEAALHTLAS